MTNCVRVCICSRWFGVRSEVWMWRQVRLFSRVLPSVITWKYENRDEFPLGGVQLTLTGTAEEPNDGPGRWLCRLHNLATVNFYGSYGAERRRIASILRANGVEVVLCHFGHLGLRILPAAQQAGVPVVVHFHGQDISSGLRNRWYRWSLKKKLSAFAAVVCVGSAQERRLIDLGMPAERIHVIPCGVPTAEFSPAVSNKHGPVTFVGVCRLVAWKGVHHTIGAFAKMVRQLPEARLVIAGDGPELGNLQALAKQNGISDRLVFLGSQPPAKIRQLLAESHVFVQHSLQHPNGWFEGFGVSIAEASAMGLPVVVSACGGIIDQVVNEETGFVVPQQDENAMAAAMLKLASDPELRSRMGRAGRQRMIEQYDTSLQVWKLEEVLLNAALKQNSVVS